jgi:hypothetical protein
MLNSLDKIRRDSELNNEKVNLKNFKWKNRKGAEFIVLKHERDKLTVGVINKRAINKV